MISALFTIYFLYILYSILLYNRSPFLSPQAQVNVSAGSGTGKDTIHDLLPVSFSLCPHLASLQYAPVEKESK